ncbi:MAG TPA: RhuM family protein [Fimbriimonadaceae bacterium]|nr:RhuM family protein [Fimbriimonadaceae bacterium]
MPDEILLYQTDDGATKLQVRFGEETVWLSQAQMADLFQTTKQNVSLHVKNIFQEGELHEESVVKDFLTTAAAGKTYQVTHYNLDVIISVGYRVKSLRGTQFRRWATSQLRDFLVKGFLLNDERFKENGGDRYFEELLQRIRDIRSSEKVFWKIGYASHIIPGSSNVPLDKLTSR